MDPLERAAQAHADVQQAERALEEARDALEDAVRDAIEAGFTQLAIGAFLGVPQPRVSVWAHGRESDRARKRKH